ncbi:MAG: hypothetical protein HWE26_22615 [Alteromonadaceae bacterium]|nr:hypothetical protein [Alteromonadaceae bacterium]
MVNIKDLINNPLVWILVLLVIQVSSTFYIEPIIEFETNNEALYEKFLSDSSVNPEIANLLKAQNDVIESRNEIIEASISFQRTIGGLCAILLAAYLLLSYRRSRVK